MKKNKSLRNILSNMVVNIKKLLKFYAEEKIPAVFPNKAKKTSF